jgi:glutamine amidotransferase
VNPIAIIDYGIGNLRSIEKAFAAGGCDAVVTSDLSTLRAAAKLVLPGVGAFSACKAALQASGFDELVRDCVKRGVPVLGICVGMQLLFDESEEFGVTPGLALLPGRVRRFTENVRVPHVGWNQVRQRTSHPLLEGINDMEFFYFVHSYCCETRDRNCVLGETEYGGTYPSVVASRRLFGVQFHPEKSHFAGLRLLRNFAELPC